MIVFPVSIIPSTFTSWDSIVKKSFFVFSIYMSGCFFISVWIPIVFNRLHPFTICICFTVTIVPGLARGVPSSQCPFSESSLLPAQGFAGPSCTFLASALEPFPQRALALFSGEWYLETTDTKCAVCYQSSIVHSATQQTKVVTRRRHLHAVYLHPWQLLCVALSPLKPRSPR